MLLFASTLATLLLAALLGLCLVNFYLDRLSLSLGSTVLELDALSWRAIVVLILFDLGDLRLFVLSVVLWLDLDWIFPARDVRAVCAEGMDISAFCGEEHIAADVNSVKWELHTACSACRMYPEGCFQIVWLLKIVGW